MHEGVHDSFLDEVLKAAAAWRLDASERGRLFRDVLQATELAIAVQALRTIAGTSALMLGAPTCCMAP